MASTLKSRVSTKILKIENRITLHKVQNTFIKYQQEPIPHPKSEFSHRNICHITISRDTKLSNIQHSIRNYLSKLIRRKIWIKEFKRMVVKMRINLRRSRKSHFIQIWTSWEWKCLVGYFLSSRCIIWSINRNSCWVYQDSYCLLPKWAGNGQVRAHKNIPYSPLKFRKSQKS